MSEPVYILGGSQTDFARNWAREGLEVFDMFAESLESAVADAGIEPGQIEVGHVGNFVADLFVGQGLIGGFLVRCIPSWQCCPHPVMRQLVPRALWPCLVRCETSRRDTTILPVSWAWS